MLQKKYILLVPTIVILSACPGVDLGFGKATTPCKQFWEAAFCYAISQSTISPSKALESIPYYEKSCLNNPNVQSKCTNDDTKKLNSYYACLVKKNYFDYCSDESTVANIRTNCGGQLKTIISPDCFDALKNSAN